MQSRDISIRGVRKVTARRAQVTEVVIRAILATTCQMDIVSAVRPAVRRV